MNEEVLRNIVEKYPDKITEPFDEMLDIIGFKALYKISKEFGGLPMYIPTTKRLFSGCVACQIKTEFNGYNAKFLSKKYDFSLRTIKSIVKDMDKL